MPGVELLNRSMRATRKLLSKVPNRVLDKPVTSLTATDCANMGREILKSKDTFVRRLLPQGITIEACKNGRTYAAAANEAVEKIGGPKVFTKKGKMTKYAKEAWEFCLSIIGLKPNATGKQVIAQAEKMVK